MNCPVCNQPFVWRTGTRSTCIGSFDPPGHSHDRNADTRDYYCGMGHRTPVAIAARCHVPGCDHRGDAVSDMSSVFVDEWPMVAFLGEEYRRDEWWIGIEEELDRIKTRIERLAKEKP